MANGKGLLIEADDFNAIRNKIINVIGTGAGNSGYGQSIQSSSVSQGAIVTANQWNALRWDIYNTLLHQNGTEPSIVNATEENVITYGAGQPNFQYNTLSDQAVENRFDLGIGQFAVESGIIVNQSVSFSNLASCTVTVTFNTADQARYFFNSGGKIRFTSSRTGGTNTAQNISWTSLLSSTGTKEFDGNSTDLNFYTLTNVYQPWVRAVPTGSYGYSGNEYVITVSSNQANNTTGGATQIFFKVEWIDGYIDNNPSPPPDQVNGTLSLAVNQVRAVGILQPTQTNFSIAPPTYAATNIATS